MMPLPIPFLPRPPLVPVIRLSGAITASPRGLCDHALGPLIERAVKRGRPAALALEINSPGGSAAQSALIAARIRRLAEEKKLPVLAFVEDVAASGGYWLATAADEIWLDASSIAGSIGVISASFGFQDFLMRQGVERRVHTAGRNKSFLDPFRAERPADVKRLNAILDALHENFIAQVKARRGAKLAQDRDLFTGDVWVGAEAVRLGLADGIGHLVPKLKERFGAKVRIVPYARKRGLFQRLGASIAEDAAMAVEERALWGRYGL
jgi:serine protease SohB